MSRRRPYAGRKTGPSPALLLRKSCLAISILLAFELTAATNTPPPDQPPAGDPSAYTNQPKNAGDTRKILKGLPPANQGAFEQANGVKGSRATALAENVLPPGQQTAFNIPTNGRPSPLYSAQPFSQQMLRLRYLGEVRVCL